MSLCLHPPCTRIEAFDAGAAWPGAPAGGPSWARQAQGGLNTDRPPLGVSLGLAVILSLKPLAVRARPDLIRARDADRGASLMPAPLSGPIRCLILPEHHVGRVRTQLDAQLLKPKSMAAGKLVVQLPL